VAIGIVQVGHSVTVIVLAVAAVLRKRAALVGSHVDARLARPRRAGDVGRGGPSAVAASSAGDPTATAGRGRARSRPGRRGRPSPPGWAASAPGRPLRGPGRADPRRCCPRPPTRPRCSCRRPSGSAYHARRPTRRSRRRCFPQDAVRQRGRRGLDAEDPATGLRDVSSDRAVEQDWSRTGPAGDSASVRAHVAQITQFSRRTAVPSLTKVKPPSELPWTRQPENVGAPFRHFTPPPAFPRSRIP